MADLFLYDTHYQIDKPFALIDLTLNTASPSRSLQDHVIARLLTENAKAKEVCVGGQRSPWKPNKDQMRYWIGNCQQSSLLSRRNSYDYWLMNFVWSESFEDKSDFWGTLSSASVDLSRLLLLRWAWIYDAPMLSAVLWYLSDKGPNTAGQLLSGKPSAIEEMIIAVLGVLRKVSQDIRLRTDYRLKIKEIANRGFKPNTRRHKLVTHLSFLTDTCVVRRSSEGDYYVSDQVKACLGSYGSLDEAIQCSVEPSPIGFGGELFLRIACQSFGLKDCRITDFPGEDWPRTLAQIRPWWNKLLTWDRKFLGIEALSELFLVQNLAKGRDLWCLDSWKKIFL